MTSDFDVYLTPIIFGIKVAHVSTCCFRERDIGKGYPGLEKKKKKVHRDGVRALKKISL